MLSRKTAVHLESTQVREDVLGAIDLLGILDRRAKNEGRAGGQYYEYEFNVSLKLVISVVKDFEGVAFPRKLARTLEEHST